MLLQNGRRRRRAAGRALHPEAEIRRTSTWGSCSPSASTPEACRCGPGGSLRGSSGLQLDTERPSSSVCSST
eukprot:3659126-Pyramimonas_sp.AAC.1